MKICTSPYYCYYCKGTGKECTADYGCYYRSEIGLNTDGTIYEPTTPLPEELVINGVKYRKVDE